MGRSRAGGGGLYCAFADDGSRVRPRFVEDCGEELRLVDGVRAIGDYRTNAAFARRLPICLRIIALVRDNGAGINIGTEVEEHFEVAAVARFAAGQMEADRIAVEIGLEMDLG